MLKHCLIGGWFVLRLAAQEPVGWVWHELPGAGATVLAVSWDTGYDLDAPAECGASRVLLECRLERARAAAPGTKASSVHVDGGAAVAFVMVDAEQWPLALQFVTAMLDERAPLSDDAIARVTARVALAADDSEWLYPGEVLASRSRTVLWAGTACGHSIGGSPTAVQALTIARVRELLAEPCAVTAIGLGVLPPELRSGAEALRFVGGPPRGPRAGSSVAASIPTALEQIGNPRTDAVFVAAAFAVPGAVDRAALAVGLEVARVRASRSLPPRPEESMARAPRIAWSWLHGDPVVVFCRRGPNGTKLDRPRQELERLIAELRENPPTAAEMAAAVQTLDLELSLPPWSAERVETLAAAPAALPGRAIALLLAARRGLEWAAIAAANESSVQGALAATLAPERTCWLAVVPTLAVAPPVPNRSR
jgi:hypothetical protein